MAERDLPGVAAGHVPGGRERAPEEDQDDAVQQVGVADADGDERDDAEERDGGPPAGCQRWHQTPSVSAPR